jgi:hypothetical protein
MKDLVDALAENLHPSDEELDAYDRDQFERESHCPPLDYGKKQKKPEPKVGPSPFKDRGK